MKRFGVMYTCLVITAVHIEMLHSMSTSSFIQALRRFITRRGQVVEIRSDNETNFVGTEKKLKVAIQQWNKQQIHDSMELEVDFQFAHCLTTSRCDAKKLVVTETNKEQNHNNQAVSFKRYNTTAS